MRSAKYGNFPPNLLITTGEDSFLRNDMRLSFNGTLLFGYQDLKP
jgi:hypothetical protein